MEMTLIRKIDQLCHKASFSLISWHYISQYKGTYGINVQKSEAKTYKNGQEYFFNIWKWGNTFFLEWLLSDRIVTCVPLPTQMPHSAEHL